MSEPKKRAYGTALTGALRNEHELSDGRKASVLAEPKVKHLIQAQRIIPATDKDLPYCTGLALVAVTTTLDGVPVVYEDLLEEPIGIGNELIAHVKMGQKKGSSGSST